MFDENSFTLDIDNKLILKYGMIIDQEVIYASDEIFENLIQIVNFAASFAMNMTKGRIEKIHHEFNDEPWTTVVRTSVLPDKRHLHFVIAGSYENFPPEFQNQILDNFTLEVDNAFNLKKMERIHATNIAEFEVRMHKIVSKVDVGLSLIHEMDAEADTFLVRESKDVDTIIHYIGISTSGIPVRNQLYNNQLVSTFKLPSKDNASKQDVLRTLMSAQFSAIVNSSLLKAFTRIAELTFSYMEPGTSRKNILIAAFFPIGYKNQYTLEICYEGQRAIVEGFRKACDTLFSKFLKVPFKGNIKEFEFVGDLLKSFPEKFDLFGKSLEESMEIAREKEEFDQERSKFKLFLGEDQD